MRAVEDASLPHAARRSSTPALAGRPLRVGAATLALTMVD